MRTSTAQVLLPHGPFIADQRLKSWQRVSLNGGVPTALHSEPQWPVQARYLVGPKTLCLTLPQPEAGNPLAILDLVFQRNCIALEMNAPRQRFQSMAGCIVDQRLWFKLNPGG
jgi:hypothetical protein